LRYRYGAVAGILGALISIVPFCFGIDRINFRNYPLIDYQIKEGFRTLSQVVKPIPEPGLDSRYARCVVFALSDPFHFGGRYFNQFESPLRCYFFSIATVITRQFQSLAEQGLILKYLGPDYVLTGKSRELVFFDLFQKLSASGFRIFFLSGLDLSFQDRIESAERSPQQKMQFLPIGNVVEIFSFGKTLPRLQTTEQDYIHYLESLKLLLDLIESKKGTPQVLSEIVIKAPFFNLGLYPRLIHLRGHAHELEEEVMRRSKRFIETSLSQSD
jgi:hypothetical protein